MAGSDVVEGTPNRVEPRASGSATLAPARRPRDPVTAAVRAGVAEDTAFGSVMPPLYLSSNYEFQALGVPPVYDYARSGNPTRATLEGALAELEGGQSAVATASGMAAVLVALHLCRPGSVVLAPKDCYGGTYRLLQALAGRGQFSVRFVDFLEPADVAEAFTPDVGMVWIETPSNPLLRIYPIHDLCQRAAAVGAVSVVDNTFLSPALQRPIELGADLVVHSTTKFINGHSDVVGGAVVAADAEAGAEASWWGNCLGVTQSPFDCYQTLRGLRTLHARVEAHARNTAAVVDALCKHEAVRVVHYPGLESHGGFALAAEQQSGAGSIVSFELRGGLAATRRFFDGLGSFSLAESLGGVESLACHPWSMTHASMPEHARTEAGIRDDLVRLSVGIESPDALAGDVNRALDATVLNRTAGQAIPFA